MVCTHMDGHNGSGNIHVHIVINSLRKLDVPQQPFMERPIDCKAGYKHHVTNEYLKHLQKSLMDLCNREFLYQVDLLSPSRTGVTEAEYWAQRRLDEKKQEIEKEGFTPNPTKFQTQKRLIRDAVAAAREKAISYEDFQNILQDEYNARTGMEYVLVGDYYLPALKLPRTRPIGRWGMLHKTYPKLRKPAYYQSLLLSGKLDTVLANVEEQAAERYKVLIEQMSQREETSEKQKEENQMEWVRRMNNLENRAAEIVKAELIYVLAGYAE